MEQVKPLARLSLLALAIDGGSMRIGEIKPEFSKKDRTILIDLKILEEYKEKNKSTGRYVIGVNLTDYGWYFLEKNMTVDINIKSKYAAIILSKILVYLQRFMTKNEISLAEILSPEAKIDLEIDDIVRKKILAIGPSLAESGGRIRLWKLREALAEFDRKILDQSLFDLQKEQLLTLLPIDNPQDITEKDRQAAIKVVTVDKHIVYFK
jgi:hypothetical protein